MPPNFLILIFICATVTAQSKSTHKSEQYVFNLGANDAVVQHPVALSDAELAVLAKNGLMRQELDQDPPVAKLSREGLEVAVVHLGSPQERDLVVVGSGSPFIGANVGPFWVIRDPHWPPSCSQCNYLGSNYSKRALSRAQKYRGLCCYGS